MSETFTKALSGVMAEHVNTSFNQDLNLSDLVEMVQEAFLAGYRAKESGPVCVTGRTLKKAKTAMKREATKALRSMYDLIDSGHNDQL